MSVAEIILGVLLIISSILIVFVVLLQEGRSAGISGAIAGGAESFLGKNKGRTVGAKLQRWTKAIAIIFFVLVFAANIVLLLV